MVGNTALGYQTDPYPTGDGNVGILMDARNGVSCTHCVVNSNTVRNVADEAIQIDAAQWCIINDNNGFGSGGTVGILLEAAVFDCQIVGNVAQGSVQDVAITAGALRNEIRNREVNGVDMQQYGIRRNTFVSSIATVVPLYAGEIVYLTFGGGNYFMATDDSTAGAFKQLS